MAFGAISGLMNAITAKKSNKVLQQLLGQDPTYQKNPLAAQQFGMANNLFFSPMFGSQQESRNIYGNNANFNAQVGRNATDGSQALALAASGQGQTDQAFSDLQLRQQQNKYGLLNNLNNAYANMIGEDDKVFEDQVRKFSNKASIKGAQMQNLASINTGFANGINSDLNDAFSVFGMFGGGGMGGGGSKNATGANPNPIIPGFNQWQQYKRK